MNKLRNICFNGYQLKLIGWLCTLCGAAAVVFPGVSGAGLQRILTGIGYIALPIFAYLLVEGFAYTERLGRYALLLGIAAVITEPLYDYSCIGKWLDIADLNGQNVLFAMLLGVLQLNILRQLGTGKAVRKFACGFTVLAAAIWAMLFNIRYGFYFELMVGIFYLLHNKEKWMFLLSGIISLFALGTPVLGILPLLAYDGERGVYNKYLFYAAWPALWLLAALVRLAV